MSIGLVLTGGGARAAYQVGVLKAVADILPRSSYNPFPIICGTSAGAINALALAGRAGPFKLRARKLEVVWNNLHPEDVYRTDALGVFANSLRVLLSLFHRGYGIRKPVSLLDNSPLRKFLSDYVKFDHLQQAIDNGELQAIAVTAMSYASGQSVCFFQSDEQIKPWNRARRKGMRTTLNIDHLMASSAIPSLFPATKVDERYYGDGALRQLKPISPALHLGADKLFIIGVSGNARQRSDQGADLHSPSIAQIVGHLLNSAFIDSMESDLETLRMVNRLAETIPQDRATRSVLGDLRPIETLSISPSKPIDKIAENHIDKMPGSLNFFLNITGANRRGGGASAASYLLFEPGFTGELIKLGYSDAMNQEDEIQRFFVR